MISLLTKCFFGKESVTGRCRVACGFVTLTWYVRFLYSCALCLTHNQASASPIKSPSSQKISTIVATTPSDAVISGSNGRRRRKKPCMKNFKRKSDSQFTWRGPEKLSRHRFSAGNGWYLQDKKGPQVVRARRYARLSAGLVFGCYFKRGRFAYQ